MIAYPNHKYSKVTSGDILGRALRISLVVASVGACSPNEGSTGMPSNSLGGGVSQGTGGAPGTGGVNSSGPSGGTPGTGGNITNISTGGTSTATVPTGGKSATGGVAATGGSIATPVTTGGNVGTGGSAAAGGNVGTGGSVATGGKTGTGGSAAAGGKTGTGGSAATGGRTSTGGATGMGTGGSGSASTCTPSATKFSFFVTSQARLSALAQAFNGSTKGFGGDLRYGQSTGLAGADKICTAIAEAAMPGNCKTWRAFLSVADNGSGAQVNAISRIGAGPWYDRLGRLFGTTTTTIVATRPDGAATIINDLPNEDGVLNHDALQTGNTTAQDNHDILTGSSATGTLYGANAHCTNWTSSAADTSKKPRVGHSWPRGSQSWISCLDESGCAPGTNLVETGGPGSDGTVGSGGGYGGFYCFALTP